VPRLLGWEYADLPADTRKTFEVALHAGSAPALAWALRGEPRDDAHLLLLTLLPPAAAGLLFERPIERRLGGPRSVAVAQIVAGAALFLADLRRADRRQADALDHLAVGLAQAAALVPGVSRSGAALTAARLRGLSRGAALSLSLRAALPVTLGAGVLKGFRAARDGVPSGLEAPVAVGAAAACLSALAALPVTRGTRWREIAIYRMSLGFVALA
jgi:undecaprenyl-diphosphatase